MKTSERKLLLNAEPFGFGPSAAVASFFPFLRNAFQCIGYLGKNHTLDLQKDLPYDALHDISDMTDEQADEIIAEYDVFFTVLDCEMAERALALGLKVIMYDPLTWYWHEVPACIKRVNLYLTQDFFGVRERLANEPTLFPPDVHVVPSIVRAVEEKEEPQYVLINLGGLQNPLWSVEDTEQYARVVIQALQGSISANELIIATSSAVAMRLDDPRVRSYSREKMGEIMKASKYAFMTPGLGNIYDAAAFDLPTVWLPPANDSQGQQLHILGKHDMADAWVDWEDMGHPINYWDDQPRVLDTIRDAIHSAEFGELFGGVVEKAHATVMDKETSQTSALLSEFGTGGAEEVAKRVIEFCS